jgi:uncharacterized protein YwqG
MPPLTTGFEKPLDGADAHPPAGSDAEILALMHSTAAEAIAFLHVFPPQYEASPTTFFGGLPLVPDGFRWPRSAVNSVPLSFLAQVDCAALPNVKFRHVLPHEGTLYFFADWELFEGNEDAQETNGTVIFAAGPAASFKEATPPEDLPPFYGENAKSHYKWLKYTSHAIRSYPTVSPKIAMNMAKLVTYAEEHPTEPNGNEAGRYQELWQEQQTAALQAVYGPPVARGTMFKRPDVMHHKASLWRPFPEYPHAWLAIELICGELIERIESSRGRLERGKAVSGAPWPKDPKAHRALYDQVTIEATHWITLAREAGLTTAPTGAEKTAFWSWLQANDNAVGPDINDWLQDLRSNYTINRIIAETVARACDECILHSAAAAALVPPEAAQQLLPHHTPLAEGNGRTAGRHQMLGRGRNIQGAPDHMQPTHILLMQLDTDAGLDWMMADCGALQYWISLEDLRAKDFDRVEVTIEGY